MNRAHLKWMTGMLALFMLSAFSWPVQGAEDAARALARAVLDRPDGRDAVMSLNMTLIEDGRSPRVRSMVSYRLDDPGQGVRTLIRFTAPADIAGTGLLTHDPLVGDSNQWIYLPAMKRVRRVDANRKGGRFVNSDYYFEDLRTRQVELDRHRLLGREEVEGVMCEVLESTPVDSTNSVYDRRVAWIDPNTLLPLRIEFHEGGGRTPAKRMQALRWEQVQGYWTVMDSVMRDLNRGHETRLVTERVVYDQGLPESLFGTRALEDERSERPYRP